MTSNKDFIDNRLPSDPAYPKHRPANRRSQPLVVALHDLVVDDDGHLLEVTSPNDKWVDQSNFIKSMNLPWIRARYLGNADDMIVCALDIRRATAKEAKAKDEYKQQTVLPV